MGFIEDNRFRQFGARCLYFDRKGGVSKEPFDSLNVSKSVGDKEDNVEKNLKIVKKEAKAETLALINQIHSSRIVEYDGTIQDADGIYTDQKGVMVCIKFADCTPIMLLDTRKRIAMAIHAGWRGTQQNISLKAVKLLISLGSKPENILVSIGPHICENCYEVGEEVASLFDSKFYKPTSSGKFLLNLESASRNQFIQAGVPEKNINSLGICTYENRNFFSYRRDRVCGRNIGGIMLL